MGLLKKKQQEVPQQPEEQKEAVLTIYTSKAKLDDVLDHAKKLFAEVIESVEVANEESFEITFYDQTWIKFSILSDPNEMQQQTIGMANFFSRAPLENEKVKEAALQQIRIFNHIIGIRFMVNENDTRTNHIVNKIYMLAQEVVGFILYPSMYLFHNSGKLLISIDGKTDYDVFYPEACSDILEQDVAPSEEDIARQERSIEILKTKGIPYIAHLKLSALDTTTTMYSKEDVIKRLIATYAASVQAEIYTCGRYDNPKEVVAEDLERLEEQYGVSKYFSEREKDYIENPDKYQDKHNLFGWCYECCAIFMWALSLIEIQEPDQICEVAKMGEIIWHNNFESLMNMTTLKTKTEVLDFQDLVFRYDWACVDARIHATPVNGLNSDVIYFWHYALNWLLQVDGITNWDDVTPNT